MKISTLKWVALPQRAVLGLSAALVLGAPLVSGAPVQAQMRQGMGMSMSYRIRPAQANRIARNYVGRGAYVVRNEGVHGGMHRIHVHRRGVARHVFVGARTGRVIKTMVLSRKMDRREDAMMR